MEQGPDVQKQNPTQHPSEDSTHLSKSITSVCAITKLDIHKMFHISVKERKNIANHEFLKPFV